MAKKAKKLQTSKGIELKIVNPNAAGIDIADSEMQVCQLCNAREVKNISEKKTDESDAEWLLVLHSYGMLKPSFQPDNSARQIRNLARHRGGLLKSASR